VKVQKQTGLVNELVVKQFEAQYLNSRILEKEVRQRILESENRINYLLGRFPQPIIREKTNFIKPIPFQVNVGIPSDLLKNRPDIRQAEYNLVAAKADVKAAKAAFYPTLNINGAYGFQAFKTGFIFTTPQSIAYTIFGSLTAPLINRSAIKSEFINANAMQREALYSYQQTIINGYVEVYNQVALIKNLDEIYVLRNDQADVLTQSVDASNDLFKSGRASYLEVLLTQRNALDSRLQLVEAKKRQYFAFVNIYKALGGGWQ
jgi:outer membrane protein, multidrug efflux system